MRRVLLIRHGQSAWNAEGRWQGRADAPLSEQGAAEARAAAQRLAEIAEIATIGASTLERARRTAEMLAAGLGLGAVEPAPGLEERDVGPWSGLTAAEIDARWPGLRVAGVPPEGWEHDAPLVARVLPALGALLERVGGDPIAVVTHGGVIRSLEHHLSGAAPPPLGNLGARWLTVDVHAVLLGERVDLLDGRP